MLFSAVFNHRQSIAKKEQQTCGLTASATDMTFLKVLVFVTFTANGKRQFLLRLQAFPLIAV